MDCVDKSEILNKEIQVLTENLANRNSEHEKLEEFKDNLKTTYDELASIKRQQIVLLRFFV
jgi:hypothetical protein